MKHNFLKATAVLAATTFSVISCGPKQMEWSGWINPVIEGRYADPEGVMYGDELWIYPTTSGAAADHKYYHFDAFSSKDLKTWVKHEDVITENEVSWLRKCFWAPAALTKDGKYYIFFSCNDIYEGDYGGIGVAVADNPAGPFHDLLGKPLVGEIVNKAQPIDQFVFQDPATGDWLMCYGGWGRCNIVRLSDDFTRLLPFADGETYKEITPEGYVEGPFMLCRDGKYYFMWSEGGYWTDDYCVAYAVADTPFGPFERKATILKSDYVHGTGPGHHSVVKHGDDYYIIYHRHPIGYSDGSDRVVCIDKLEFDENGDILPVKMS